MMKSNLTLILCLCWLLVLLPKSGYGQSEGSFAELIRLSHACNQMGGSVEFGLTGNPADYTYYWEHGPSSLSLKNLAPGSYTLVVLNQFGCEERYDIKILLITNCYVQSYIYNAADFCTANISNVVKTSDGWPIPASALSYTWSDGYTGGLNRTVSKKFTASYCVTITANGSDDTCCETEKCFTIQKDTRCTKKDCVTPFVSINEVRTTKTVGKSFVELLVDGDCDCKKGFDIRGIKIDDNNGKLVKTGPISSPANLESVGVSPGFLMLSYDEQWASVPNGSLIVIYDENSQASGKFPNDDPSDANGDGVYVLPANHSSLLAGKTGTWNTNLNTMEYNGTLINPSWNLIQQNPDADGMQTRNLDGSLNHGISRGTNANAEANTFPLWLTGNGASSLNVRFTGEDLWSKNAYSFDNLSNLQSPGLPNSTINTTRIKTLNGCNDDEQPIRRKSEAPARLSTTSTQDQLKVNPNPFKDKIQLNYDSKEAGTATLYLHSIAGQELYHRQWSAKSGEASLELEIDGAIPPGILILKFVFPSGETNNIRLVKVTDE
ncbi:MAG: hypothetical protein AAF705_18155 [Bacteroidota bacterium]